MIMPYVLNVNLTSMLTLGRRKLFRLSPVQTSTYLRACVLTGKKRCSDGFFSGKYVTTLIRKYVSTYISEIGLDQFFP